MNAEVPSVVEPLSRSPLLSIAVNEVPPTLAQKEMPVAFPSLAPTGFFVEENLEPILGGDYLFPVKKMYLANVDVPCQAIM